jgi:hypothetical protein
MIEIKLTPPHFEEILKRGYSLDIIFLLKMCKEEYDNVFDSVKIRSIEQAIQRKGLINEKGGLTDEGRALLAFLSSTDQTPKLVKKKPSEDDFTKWWKTYRPVDTIYIKDKTGNPKDEGILFSGSRGLKVKKDECKIKFNKIISEGEYTAEDLIRALEYEIRLKIQKSIETKQNKLTYLQNSLTYLNQKTYENFIEISKNNQISEKKAANSETYI